MGPHFAQWAIESFDVDETAFACKSSHSCERARIYGRKILHSPDKQHRRICYFLSRDHVMPSSREACSILWGNQDPSPHFLTARNISCVSRCSGSGSDDVWQIYLALDMLVLGKCGGDGTE